MSASPKWKWLCHSHSTAISIWIRLKPLLLIILGLIHHDPGSNFGHTVLTIVMAVIFDSLTEPSAYNFAELMNRLSPFKQSHHLVAAVWFDFSFGTEHTFSVSNVLNSLFFDGRETFAPEQNLSHGQLSVYDLLEMAICTKLENKGPIAIWNLRVNAFLDGYSKYLDLIFDSAHSILIFANKPFIPIKYEHTFKRKLDIFQALTSGNVRNGNLLFYNDRSKNSRYMT